MKMMNVRRVALLLLVAFVVAVVAGAVLPGAVMARVTSVLTGGKAAIVRPNVWDGGCTICYDHSIPGHWENGVWIPIEVVRVCHYYNPCPIE